MRRVRNGIVSLIGVCIITLLLSGITMAQQDKVIELTYGEPYPVDHTFSVVDKDVDGQDRKRDQRAGKIQTLLGRSDHRRHGRCEGMDPGSHRYGLYQSHSIEERFSDCQGKYMIFFYGANQEAGGKVFKELLTKFPEIDRARRY